jgi:DNA polymerase-3 subunit beta
MRFSCTRAPLSEIVSLCGQAVASKSTKRIFECIRITATKEGLELTGTDLEVAIRHRLTKGVEVSEPGQAVVPGALFASILREVGDDRVGVISAKQKLTLETDGGVFELDCEDVAQFPEIPAFPERATGKVKAEDLRALVRKTVFAAGKEAARFVLNGVRVMVEADGLRFVATDGRRLAMLTRPVQREGESGDRAVVVGVKGLQQFERVAGGAGEMLEIALAERYAALRTEDAEVTVRVMDGSFPDYGQIVPKEAKATAVVPVDALASRLRQVGYFASVESRAVVLTFKEGELGVSAAGGDGRATVRVAVEYEGSEERVGFNPAFLLDALKVVDGETVEIALSGANAAAKLSDGSGFLYVVMPVLVD